MRRRTAERSFALVAAVGAGTLLLSACGTGDGRDLRPATAPAPAPTTTTTPSTAFLDDITEMTFPVTVAPTIPEPRATSATSGSDGSDRLAAAIVFDQLWSPEPGVAQVIGTGAVATDPVTVDGAPADVISFEVATDADAGVTTFDARLFVEAEGAHTVCVGASCGRVFVLAPGAETPEEVIAKIDDARALANEIVPVEAWFPGWTFEIGGLLSGTGGSIDVAERVVYVYRNRGRTVDDFVRTILHEYGHVADEELLTNQQRTEFAALRGFAPGTPWRIERAGHRLDDWAATPSEDFADAVAHLWSGGRWEIRTDGGPLTDDQRGFLESIVTPER